MSKILTVIGPQSFELVRDRVAEILADELAEQFILTGNDDNNATVFLERTIPVDKTEPPIIIVAIQRSAMADHSTTNTDEMLTINIDGYHKSKSSNTNKADQSSMLKLQRLLGICRAILEDPQYKTLGFQNPFIMSRRFESLDFADPGKQDASSISMGRLVFNVRIPENTALLVPVVADGFDTKMTLVLTDKGYTYTVNA